MLKKDRTITTWIILISFNGKHSAGAGIHFIRFVKKAKKNARRERDNPDLAVPHWVAREVPWISLYWKV